MPYPLPRTGDPATRQRLIPPLGCPGGPELVWPVDAADWLALGYRRVPLEPQPLELYWQPEVCAAGSFVIWLLLQCQGTPPAAITVVWDDNCYTTEPWPADNRLRHTYLAPTDLMVKVHAAAPASLQAALAVHGLQCPCRLRPPVKPPAPAPGGLQPLIPGAGLMGCLYDGRRPQRWHLRLAAGGGLRFVAQPPDGDAALALAPFSTDGSGLAGGVPGSTGDPRLFLAGDGQWRPTPEDGTRWWHGDGPPGGLPQARSGDFYLDDLSGSVYVLEEP